MSKKRDIKIKTQYVFSEKNQVLELNDKNEWYPINFQWIPLMKINDEINNLK